jgi:hypothetical protein
LRLLNFPRPTDKKVLRQFLSLCSYYKKFVPHFAQLASALNDLLKKGRRFQWSEELEKAFTDIKPRFACKPIFKTPDFNKPFSLAVDASEKAVGAYLFQQFDGLEHRICYFSKGLNNHQRRYATIEKEALALIFGVIAFSIYFGSSPVNVYTEHSPLQFLQRMSNVNHKHLRWNLELQTYNLNIKHRPRRLNVIPDILSTADLS